MKVSATGIGSYQPEEPLEKAWYTVSVSKAELASTRSGRSQLVLDLVIEDGPTQSDGSEPTGRQLRDYILLSTDGMQPTGVRLTMEKLHNTLEGFEIPLKGDEFEVDDFLNASALALIKAKPDNDGVLRANVQRYKPL